MDTTRHGFSLSRYVAATAWVALVACGLVLPGVSAQETDRSQIIEKIHRPSFDFEQCTSLCQIELDSSYFACSKNSEAEQAFDLQACWTRISSKFEGCRASCPADTGP